MNSTVIEHFPVGALGCVCTIFGDPETGEAIVVDGGADIPQIVNRLSVLNLRVKALLYTHAHIDHIGESAELRRITGARTALHAADLPLAALLDRQAAMLGLSSCEPAIFDDAIGEGDALTIGACRIDVLHTPGHTPGSTCFALKYADQTRLLSGDTLFAGSVGRWDLGGTSLADIVSSIRDKLLPFSDDTIVIPGHGATTTIGVERHRNPFLVTNSVT